MEQDTQLTAEDLTTEAAVRPEPPTLRQRAKWIAALAVTVGIFAILLRQIPWHELADALRGARLAPLLAAAALSIIIKVFVGADKWRRILTALSCRVSLGEVMFVRTATAPFRLTPGKVGTLVAAVYLWRHCGFPFAKGVSSLVLERLQNLAVLLAFAVLGPMLFQLAGLASLSPSGAGEFAQDESAAISGAIPAHVDLLFSPRALLVSAICLVGLAVLYAFRRPLYALVARMNVKLANIIRHLASCFHEIRPVRQASLLVYAAAAQVGELAMGYLIFRAVGVSAPFGTVFVGLALMVVVSNIPVTVNGFGLRELTVVYLFGGPGTQARPELLAVGMLISAIGYMLPVVIGIPLLGPFVRRLTARAPARRPSSSCSPLTPKRPCF